MKNSLICLFLLFVFCCQALAQQNPLRVVADERKLLQYPHNGEAHGPSADILRLLLTEAKLESDVEFMPWSRAYKTALSEPNILLMTIIRTTERENNFHWITKVSNTVYSFISLKQELDRSVSTLSEAKQKITAVIRDSNSHTYLKDRGFSEDKNLYLVSNVEDAIKLLLNKKVDLVFSVPAIFVNYYADKNLKSDDFIRYRPIEETRKEGYIALSKSSDKSIIRKLLAAKTIVEKMPEYQQLVAFRPLLLDDEK